MATAAQRVANSGIFWMNGVSGEAHSLMFVPVDRQVKHPSVSSAFKLGTKMRAKRTSGSRAEVPLKKVGHKLGLSPKDSTRDKEGGSSYSTSTVPRESIVSSAIDSCAASSQVTADTCKPRSQVSLKDLCTEDKQRIAKLVQELARVNEEKEESVQRLREEQECFERKILQLEQQNLIIAKERESLQQQYRECQELLGLYQQYLSQQREKLNQSNSQLSQFSSGKVLISEEAPSRISNRRANGSICDGSYLCLAASHVQKPQEPRGIVVKGQPSAPSSYSCECVCSTPAASSGQKELRAKPIHSGERHNAAAKVHYHREQERHTCRDPSASEAQEALTGLTLGKEDWEQKRHQLLLQKMQLEVEKERLQMRLVEQGERLRRQNQQLCQSRIDYSRFQEAAQAELHKSITNGEWPPEGSMHHHLPSSVNEGAEPVNTTSQDEHSHILPATPPPQKGTHSEAAELPRRDAATSPVTGTAPIVSRKPRSVLVAHRSPDTRLDLSMNELLEIFSPVLAPRQSKKSAHRFHNSSDRELSPSSLSRPHSSQQDLEESQMLEDIFFIC